MTPEQMWCRAGDAGRMALDGSAVLAPLARKDFDASCDALVGILSSVAASKALKAFCWERRPNGEDGNSFPSQHTAEAFAAATSLWRTFGPAAGSAALATAALVAASRVLGRKHHPWDVAFGAGMGTFAGLLAGRLRREPGAPPGFPAEAAG